MTATGVFCARVRVEEKQIIAAIGEAGCVAVPVPLAGTPLPPGPASSGGSVLGDLSGNGLANGDHGAITVVIDRVGSRTMAAATLPLLRASGIATIDAGVAATGTRLQVAATLEQAGIARPTSLVGFSEATANTAASQLGFPLELFGLQPGSSSTTLLDADTAEAVIEHRVVLGGESESIVLLQTGAPAAEQRSMVHVVGGKVTAYSGAEPGTRMTALAEAAADALGATLVAIELATTAEGLVVWDVHPVADFRNAQQIGTVSVAGALAKLVHQRQVSAVTAAPVGGEVRHDYVLSA